MVSTSCEKLQKKEKMTFNLHNLKFIEHLLYWTLLNTLNVLLQLKFITTLRGMIFSFKRAVPGHTEDKIIK